MSNGTSALRLDTRLCHFSTEDLQQIVDGLFGNGAYLKLIGQLDKEILKPSVVIRKGTTEAASQEIADRRLRLAVEMQESRRYRKTKLGKLESHYLPVVHQLRTADKPMSWPNLVRFLKVKYRFSVSVPYLCRIYDGWLKRIKGE